MRRLLSFPPICSQWCVTYSHLLHLSYTALERCRLCHKCIAWRADLRENQPDPQTQPRLPLESICLHCQDWENTDPTGFGEMGTCFTHDTPKSADETCHQFHRAIPV